VVDATGANSSIRTLMQLNTNPARHADRWCVCDVRCLDLNVPERWTWVEVPFNGGRAVWQHMMADNVWRLDYQLDPESDPADAANPQTSMEQVRSHLGPAVSFDLVWVGPWEYRTQVHAGGIASIDGRIRGSDNLIPTALRAAATASRSPSNPVAGSNRAPNG
jgi:3-(3-hydroxy-phenyl)propionate hydroxylase